MPVTPQRRTVPEPSGTPHTLGPNDASPRPFRMLFLDVETFEAVSWEDTTYHKFYLGASCYYQRRPRDCRDTVRWKDHDSQESMLEEIEYCTQDKSCLYVVASNPNFDLWTMGFYERMWERGWTADFFYSRGLRFVLSCSKGDRTIRVCAIQNFYSASVADLGDMVGLEKLDCDIAEDSRERVREYCRRDVEIVRDAFLHYLGSLDRRDCGGFGLTISSQAYKAFRHGRMDCELWVHKDPEALRLERKASYGGRSEAFYLGDVPETPVLELDVNSLYPWVMYRWPYPTNLVGVIQDPDRSDVETAVREGCAIADVTLQAGVPVYPLRLQERTCFPVGTFRTHLCTPGLIWALEESDLVDVHTLAVYEKGRPFRSFVREFYDLRKDLEDSGHPLEAYAVKMLLNSLYGKIGQAPPDTDKNELDDWGALYRRLHIPEGDSEARMVTALMGTRFEDRGRKEGRDSLPSVSAHIQAYARWYLAELMLELPRNAVYYCDTDSVWIPADRIECIRDWIDPDRLGYLEVEREVEDFVIHGVKDYKADGERVIKGIPKDATRSRGREWVMEKWPGLRALLNCYPQPTMPGDMPSWWSPEEIAATQREGLYPVQKQRKVLDGTYYKGRTTDEGWVQPYVLPRDMPS